MKRYLAILLLFVIATSFAGASRAQSEREYSFLVSLGLGFAATPEAFTDYYVMGYTVTLGLDFPVSPKWSLVGFVDAKLFSPDEGMILDWYTDPDEWPDGTNHKVSEGALGAVTFGLTGKGKLKSETSTTYPFIRGGIGLTISGADEIKVDYRDSNGDPAVRWHMGVNDETNISALLAFGVEFERRGSIRSWFLELGLHTITQEDNSPGIGFVALGLTL